MKMIRTLSLLGCLTAAAFGQATREQVATMAMWPTVPVKWLGSTDFSRINYGYYLDGSANFGYSDGNFTDWSKWRFAIYTGLTGKDIYYWGAWGYPTPGPPVRRPDGRLASACEHTHLTWSSWFFFDYYSGGVRYSGWTRGAGGGLSGVRVNDYTCTMSLKNSHNNGGLIENAFGWGNSSGSIRMPKVGNPFTIMIVGASALSHGALGCSSQGCVNNPRINAYAIPW
jgi:hypothetical protein